MPASATENQKLKSFSGSAQPGEIHNGVGAMNDASNKSADAERKNGTNNPVELDSDNNRIGEAVNYAQRKIDDADIPIILEDEVTFIPLDPAVDVQLRTPAKKEQNSKVSPPARISLKLLTQHL